MALNSGKILMRRGQEVNFDPNKMMPGEWAVSLDSKYVRMCFSPGVCVRMATYDAFESDMVQIQRILAECQTIEEAVERINDEISVKAQAVAEYASQAKQYRDEAKSYKEQASAIANVDMATESNMGLMAGGENSVDGGVLTLTKTTNDKTLQKSYKGGIIINEILGESLQDMLPSPDSPQEIKSVKISGITACGKNLWNLGDVSGTISNTKTFVLEVGEYTISAYVISNDTNQNTCLVQFNHDDGTNSKVYLTRNSRNSKTITLAKSVKSIGFYASIDWTNAQGDAFEFKDIQIEKGKIVTDYEPYQETKATLSTPITLNGIGSVKDILCKQDGVYGVSRKIGEYTFPSDGRYEIADNNDKTNKYFRHATSIIPITPSSNIKYYNALSTHFINGNPYSLSGNVFCLVSYSSSEIRFRNGNLTTIEELQEWLTNNEVKIIYELPNPTFEPLPESDQIALHQLESQNRVTHLFIESVIVPVMEVEYGTSKAGAYAIKGMNVAEANAIRYNSLMAATLMLNQE